MALYVITKEVSFLGYLFLGILGVQGSFVIFLKVLSRQFQNKKNINIDDSLDQWKFIQYVPIIFFLHLELNSVAFVLFKKNNKKLISLFKEKKIRKHNFVKSPSKEFLFLTYVQSCLRYGSQYPIRKHLTQRDKVRRYDRLMNGLPLSAIIAIINSTEGSLPLSALK